MTREIRNSLPKYEATANRAPPSGTSAERDPNALELPKFMVREKRATRLSPDDLLIPSEVDKKMKRQLLDSLSEVSALNRVLNGFSIPLLSPTLAERGRVLDRARQLQNLNRIIDLGKLADPGRAAELKKASAESDRIDEWQNRPAGAK